MDIKNISKFTDKIDDKILSEHMLRGRFFKRKGDFDLDAKKKRWCFMITKRPIDPNIPYEKSMINEKELPSWMKFDVIYYFTDTDDNEDKPNNK